MGNVCYSMHYLINIGWWRVTWIKGQEGNFIGRRILIEWIKEANA